MKSIISTIIVLLVCVAAFAQTKLSLLDGTQYNAKEYTFFNDNGNSMEIRLEKKNGKLKTKFIDLNEIWAVGDSIMYVPTQEGEYSVEDMKYVVIGKQIAKGYRISPYSVSKHIDVLKQQNLILLQRDKKTYGYYPMEGVNDNQELGNLNADQKKTLDYIIAYPGCKEKEISKKISNTEFNAWWACAGGFAVGAGSMLYFYGHLRRPMIGLAVPIVYATGISFTRPTKKGIIKRHPEYRDNEYFVYGYQNKGNRKIFTNTIIGTLSGLLVGGLVSMAIPAK